MRWWGTSVGRTYICQSPKWGLQNVRKTFGCRTRHEPQMSPGSRPTFFGHFKMSKRPFCAFQNVLKMSKNVDTFPGLQPKMSPPPFQNVPCHFFKMSKCPVSVFQNVKLAFFRCSKCQNRLRVRVSKCQTRLGVRVSKCQNASFSVFQNVQAGSGSVFQNVKRGSGSGTKILKFLRMHSNVCKKN